MRILSIHADSMWYHATQKTKMAEPIDAREDTMKNCVVLFCCVEKLDEKNPAHVIASATKNLMVRLAKLKVEQVMIYPYAHLTTPLDRPRSRSRSYKGSKNLSGKIYRRKTGPVRLVQGVRDPWQGTPARGSLHDHLPVRGYGMRFHLPVLPSPDQGSGLEHTCAGAAGCSGKAGNRRKDMTDTGTGTARHKNVILLLGCPEVPVQMAIALYMAYNLKKRGTEVLITGNPSVLNLLKVSDPEKHYVTKTMVLEKCIAEVVGKKRDCDLCVVFAHNDAAIAYAATMRHLLPKSRLVVIVFGRNPGSLAERITFPCEKIVDKAVHNPMQLKMKINEVFGWAVSRT